MCGINGIFAYGPSAAEPHERECLAVRDAMAARGPDGEGFYRDPDGRLLLGHRRLAVIDLSDTGAQPMTTANGELVITFNGEIYNYRELRAELATEGVCFTGRSDTEVLLHLYRRYGAAMVDRLQGMFAFALWDRQSENLVLARDPHGVKPLYYADDGSVLRFASSVRAFFAGSGVSRAPDAGAVVGFLAWGSVPEPRTLYRDVRALPAGSTLTVAAGHRGEPRSYWTPASVYAAASAACDPEELDRLTRMALLESVGRHLVADVPLGLFLSGGVDSGALLGLASELRAEPPHTVTLAFAEFRGRPEDEAPLAEQVARHYGARHTTVTLSAQEVRDGLDDFLAAMDQPTVDGLNVYWISRAVRRAGLKAALSGLGGDELFGGYPTFRNYPLLRRWAGLGRLPGLSWAAAVLGPRQRRAKLRYLGPALRRRATTYHLLRGLFTPAEIRVLVGPEIWHAAGSGEDLTRPVEAAWEPEPATAWSHAAVAEQCVYMRQQLLRDADWASMRHGLELRVPLVDRRLTAEIGPRLAAGNGRRGKAPLAASPRPPLPLEILSRPKTGFAMPLATWVAEDCRAGRLPVLSAWLSNAESRAFVDELARDVARGHCHWSRIWALRVLAHLLPAAGP